MLLNFFKHCRKFFEYKAHTAEPERRYFNDYNILQHKDLEERYILEKKLDSVVPRLYCVFAIFTLSFLVIILRMMDLAFMNIEEVNKIYHENFNDFTVSRADIIDRNGEILASNIITASLHAHPKQLIDKKQAARQIAALDIGLSYEEIYNKFTGGKEFIWLKRHLTPKEQQMVHNLGIPGIHLNHDNRRVYTHETLFSHVLGYVDIDCIGIAGIEKSYNDRLTKNVKEPLQLSLDSRVQHILRQSLQNAITTHSASGGIASVMNVNNGEILGMVSLPDFNPHNLSKAKHEQLFNQATLGVYEMGSTFKVFTVAMGLDSGKISVNDIFDVSHPLKIGRFQINDYKGKGGSLSVPEVLMYSSNLGVAQIAKLVGIKRQRQFLGDLGLLSDLAFDTPEIGRPLYPSEKRWTDISATTISYGHGIAVTPMHLMQGFAAVVNGGTLYKPTLIKYPEGQQQVGKKVIKTETSEIMRKILRLTAEHGSARKANVDGYLVGGKTGTSEKNSGGRYNKKVNIAIFAGVFPIHDPEYIVIVAIDAAKPNSINSGITTGGMIAAPLSAEIIKTIGPILGVSCYDHTSPEILEAMYLDYRPQYKTFAKR